MNKRTAIALIGASSTGKTTVFNLLKTQKLFKGYSFKNESTRNVLKAGYPINEQGTDATQLAIAVEHLRNLNNQENLVLDRSFLDLVIYTRHLTNVGEVTRSYIEDTWRGIRHSYTHFVYFPIEFKSVEDGVRSTNEKWRREIDLEILKELQSQNLNFLTIKGSPNQRIQQIIKYITQ